MLLDPRAKFCLAPPGDGWSPRIEDCVLHGAIPVIIMDGVHAPFESLLDWPSFSLRVAEDDLAKLPQLLAAVPAARVKAMQANLAKVTRGTGVRKMGMRVESDGQAGFWGGWGG